MLVAPVYTQGATSVEVYLPEDKWVHLWSKEEYCGGTYKIEAPIGQPAVFYRKDSEYKKLFEMLK